MKRSPSSRSILSVVLLVALSFAWVGSAQATASGPPDHTFILQGVVQSGGTHDIQGLGGAQVTLLEATEGPPRLIGRAVTDQLGRFAIADCDDNVWVGDFGPMLPGNVFTGRLTKLAGANPATRPAGLKMGDPISPATGYTLPSAGS
jgi:hypothetical protein